jgi:hypothetical protein
VRKQPDAKLAIAPGVRLEKLRITPNADRFSPVPFDNRSMQAHQFPHSSSRAHGLRDAGAIQIDHDHLGFVTVLSDEEVADVKVAMTSARVVETPNRGARSGSSSKQATSTRA